MLNVVQTPDVRLFWTLPLAELEQTLAGPARDRVRYAIAVDQTHIAFGAVVHRAPNYDATAEGFTEGLWRADCLELFVANPANGHYVEFNLAPGGAWWSCIFSAPRVRTEFSVRVEDVEFRVGNPWRAFAVIAIEEICNEIGFEPWTANFTACLGAPNDEPEKLYTAAPLGAIDFHRPHEFLPFI